MAAMDDLKKKYKPMENVLIQINSKVIALQNSEKKRNNIILDQVTNKIITLMKQKDPLFGNMYERQFYGGSYYDNLKVGNPNEYDLDLILNLPVLIDPRVKCSDQPGWVVIEIEKYDEMAKRPEVESKKYEKLHTLLENSNYLSTNKVLKWMERTINLSFNEMPKIQNCTYVDVVFEKDKPAIRVFVKMSKGAPAFTIKLNGTDTNGSDIQLDIDLVPCFQFTDKINWPDKSGGYRSNPSTVKNKFLVVPKKPKGEKFEKSPNYERYWRLSFQEQEREMIGQDLKTLKPSLRLLKKLRDRHNHKIASYFIKTVFLWTLEEEPITSTFWVQPLSVVFMSMLKKYTEMVRVKTISYYWNKDFNLIENLNDATKIDLANTLQNIIVDVEKKLSDILIDPLVIGKYLLQPEEFEKFKQEVSLPKKTERSISWAATNAVLTVPSPDTVDSTTTPLEKLKFEQETIVTYRQMSDLLEEKDRRYFEFIKEQISQKPNGVSVDDEILANLKKIDEKMDKMLEKFDKLRESNREHESRLIALEEQIRQLHMENRNLRMMAYGTEPAVTAYCQGH